MKHLLTLALFVCLGTFAHAQIPSYVPPNGLVGWWPFNGNANDESGNGNHGTVNGATLAADRFGNAGKAYRFSSNINKITIDSLSISGVTEYSFIGWYKKDSGSNNLDGTIISGTNGCNGTNSTGLRVFVGNDNTTNFSVETNICSNGVAVSTSNFNSSNGNWHFFAGVFKCSNINIDSSSLNLFIDGKWYFNKLIQQPNNLPLSPIYSNGYPIIFGNTYVSNDYFMGLLDDIAIYNRALTPAEVQQLYLGNSSNTSAASTVPGKIHYQGLAVGANGKPIKNGTVGLRLSVLDSLPNGSTLYTETQTASTDAAGIFSTYLGGGTATAGTFANIPWANGNDKFLKVEMDAQGGTNYQNMGSTQLVSVPYALHAGSAKRASELVDSAGNAYQIKIVNGQPTLVSAPSTPTPGSFACGQAVTYAGESYPTVQIGSQCWFQKNVNAGTMVLGANDQTNNGILEKYCYNNIPAHCDTFGGLYQWGEAVQYHNRASNISSPSPAFAGNVQGICPTGWHVPTFSEVSTMLFFASDSVCNDFSLRSFLCSGIANNLRATNFWKITNNGPNTNSSGFNALPSEKRNSIPLFFTQSNAKENAWFWTSNEANDNVFTGINLWMNYNDDRVILETLQKRNGFSVRCLKD